MRKTKDAIDVETGEKIYFRSHATQTFMSDGRTVEQAIKSGGGSGGGSYDDTEIREQLTELSAEVGAVSERMDELEKGGQGGGASVEGDTLIFSASSSAQVIGNTLKL